MLPGMNPAKNLTILNIIHIEEIDRSSTGGIPALLKALQKNSIDKKHLIGIISRRYQVAHFFEDMLRYMIDVIRNDGELSEAAQKGLFFAVEQNLKEELGEVAEYGGPHREGRRIFLTALGFDYQLWSRDLGMYDKLGILYPSARKLIEFIREVISRGSVEAVAALWYYENRISLDGIHGDYYILLSAFEKQFPEFKKTKYQEGDALWHLASHAQHDEYHAQLAENGLHAVASRTEVMNRITTTCRDMQIAFDTFWEDVYAEL